MKRWFLALLLISLWLGGCAPVPSPTPTAFPASVAPSPTPATAGVDHLLISEVMAGVQGNNNYEFIELYNPTDQPVDLQDWALWYQLKDTSREMLVYRWHEVALVPPHGYWLLVRAGQEVGAVPDATFEQPLNTTAGGLRLRAADGSVVDALAWGNGPTAYTEGRPAPRLENGVSLERAPGGQAGNGQDTDDNAADFTLQPDPNPQNSGSPAAPALARVLEIQLDAPETVAPGEAFAYTLTVTNSGDQPHEVIVVFPLPAQAQVKVGDLPDGVTLFEEGVLTWTVGVLDAGAQATLTLPVQAPWTPATLTAASYHAATDGEYAFGPPVLTRVEGVVPVVVARALDGLKVTVEGVATMYTGGYYAGGGNVKFYLQDDSGGIQVQVFGGMNVLDVPIGARVRVYGEIGAYRGSKQIVPLPQDVEILDPPGVVPPVEPLPVTLQEVLEDPALLGRLIQVEGTITRLYEGSYSYEVDLADESGNTLTLYVDKLTEATVETFEEGDQMRAVGILEVRDDVRRLYPRLQVDMVRVLPPVLTIEAFAPHNVQPGEIFTVTLTATNHTPEALTNVVIEAPLPAGATLVEVLDGGQVSGGGLRWTVTELPSGASAAVRFTARAGNAAQILLRDYTAQADQWTEPATGPARYLFLGSGVPIWAIQGDGFRSPFVGETLTTEGVVTAIFPDLGGFWMQSIQPDDDPNTSEGLFVTVSNPAALDLQPGDQVRVAGRVREAWQQTTLLLDTLRNLEVVAHDQPLPEAVSLDPPADNEASAAYYEALEGMLVRADGPFVVVAPTNRYGETVMVPMPYADRPHLYRDADYGFRITVDDGLSGSYADQSEMPYAAATGDQMANLYGPLAFTYGQYKVEPLTLPVVTTTEHTLPQLPLLGADEFAIMTWNVENLFDAKPPNPSNPPMPLPSEYRRDVAKVANTILAAGAPTVVGLQEVENIGVLQDIAAHEALAGFDYQPILIEGHDSRGIDVGYLVRGDQAEVLDVQQFDAPEGLTSRPPLLVHLRVQTASGAVELYVINNHFTSMAGGEAATEPRRAAQAAWNVTILQQITAQQPDALVAIIGDLNSFYDSRPLDVLREAGLRHVMEGRPLEDRFTYIYQGVAQELDHILVTPRLMSLLRRADALRTNTDYPLPLPDDTSPMHKSDHDPLIAVFAP